MTPCRTGSRAAGAAGTRGRGSTASAGTESARVRAAAAEVNSRLLGELQTLAQLPPAEREAVLLEQLGPEAVDRLHQLEQSQQGFEQQLAGYLAELTPLPALDRAEQQQEILARWFPAEQWRRVEALTRLRLEEQP
ncbi:hypothetical protein G9457_02920 [Aeromonas salmonicida subsp. masoucida]|nr:hypothetical protein G9457_02920 [Aeromonas salmonicida subsp. masoucida]